MAKLIISEKFSMVNQDWVKVGKNALVFAGPALLVLIASLVNILPKDASWIPIALYVLNVLTDLLRKFLAENTYKPKGK